MASHDLYMLDYNNAMLHDIDIRTGLRGVVTTLGALRRCPVRRKRAPRAARTSACLGSGGWKHSSICKPSQAKPRKGEESKARRVESTPFHSPKEQEKKKKGKKKRTDIHTHSHRLAWPPPPPQPLLRLWAGGRQRCQRPLDGHAWAVASDAQLVGDVRVREPWQQSHVLKTR